MKSLKGWLTIMLVGGLLNVASLIRVQRGVDYVMLGFPLPWLSISSGGTLGATIWERTRVWYEHWAFDWIFYVLIVWVYYQGMKPNGAGEDDG